MSALSPSKFFRFKEEKYWAGSQPIVGFAAREIVESRFTLAEMSAIFGGYVEYESSTGDQRYWGVWGDRNVSKFLRLLRERGAAMEIENGVPSQFRQRHRASR